MFEELLVKTCDREQKDLVNRTFPRIVQQLARDEARLLRWVTANRCIHAAIIMEASDLTEFSYGTDTGIVLRSEQVGGPGDLVAMTDDQLDNPRWVSDYYNHLYRLGIVTSRPVPADQVAAGAIPELPPDSRLEVLRVHLTPFGHRFVSACFQIGG